MRQEFSCPQMATQRGEKIAVDHPYQRAFCRVLDKPIKLTIRQQLIFCIGNYQGCLVYHSAAKLNCVSFEQVH